MQTNAKLLRHPFHCLISLILCFSITAKGQPLFNWATFTEGTHSSNRSIAIAVKGSTVLTTGTYDDIIDFDPTAGVYSLPFAGIYALKSDTTGYLEFPMGLYGSTTVDPTDIKVDNSGNFYMAGSQNGSTDFDAGTPYVTLPAGPYLAKYDAVGNYQWCFGIGTFGSIESIAIDQNDNVYTIGYFSNRGDFDPGSDSSYLTSLGSHDIFIAKYTASGTLRWVNQIGGLGTDRGQKLSIDANGDLYFTGVFEGIAYVNAGSFSDTLSSIGSHNLLLGKMDSSGNFIWIKTFECTDRQDSYGLEADDNNNIMVTGTYRRLVDLDPGIGVDTFRTTNLYEIFLVKLSADGAYLWGHSIGSSGSDYGYDLSLDNANNVIVVGTISQKVDFDPGPDSAIFEGTAAHNYLVKYDPSGNFVWAVTLTSRNIHSVTIDPDDGIYFTGELAGDDTVDFDPGPDTFLVIGGNNDPYDYDLFTAKYRSRTITDTQAVSICVGDSYTLGYKTYTKTGTYYRTYAVKPGLDSMVVLNLTVEGPDTTVTRPDPKSLQASDPNATYQWVDCDNGYMPISGATSQTFTPAVNGNYAVIVIEGGCTDTSACYAVTTIGIDPEPTVIPCTLYPNPATNTVNINFYLPKSTKAKILMFDMQGRMVLNRQLSGLPGQQVATFDVSALNSGMYQVLLQTKKGQAIKRLVINR